MVQHTSLKAPWRESRMKYLHGRRRTDLPAAEPTLWSPIDSWQDNWGETKCGGRHCPDEPAEDPPATLDVTLSGEAAASSPSSPSFEFVKTCREDVRLRTPSLLGPDAQFPRILCVYLEPPEISQRGRTPTTNFHLILLEGPIIK